MKTYKKSIIFVIMLVLAGFVSCVEQEFDEPPGQELPEGETLTIQQVKDLYPGTGAYKFTEDKYLYATVIADESSGNLYKQLFIQDNTGGLNIRMTGSANHVSEGDSVQIILKDLIISQYASAYQLDSVKSAYDIIVLENNVPRNPAVVTINDLKSHTYTSQLVKLENVQFTPSDTSKTFADGYGLVTENRMLMDCDKNQVIVRTSGYSNFANEPIPDGKGSLVAVVGRFNNDVQLLIRNLNEVELTGERCEGGTGPVDAVEVLREDFNTLPNYGDPSTLNGWTNYLVAGDRGWQAKDFNGDVYVQASGYQSGLSEMETWLITPPLDLTGGDRALAFESSIAYWEHTSGHPGSVLISTDFDGSNVEAATWTELSVTLAGQNSSNYSWVESGEVDLSAFTGKGYIAFKYVGSDTETTTFAIDNFVFDQKGNTGGNGGGGGGTGSGTFDDPYDVEYAINNNSGTGVWVEGYLVGVYETVDADGNQLSDFAPSFEMPYYTTTNVIIAADAAETDIANCVVVQLPSGEIRNTTNLSENAGNEDKIIKYMGNLEPYFGEAGLKSTVGYWLDGTGIKPGDTEGIFVEEFLTDLGQFTAYNVNGDQIWGWDSYDNGCAKMSGYQGSNYANEDWLISPTIDLSGKSNVVLTFRQAVNYLDEWNHLQVMVSEDYSGSGDPNSATWTALTGWDQDQPGSSWDFFDSGEVPLTNYEGKTFYLAFKYVSTTSGGSTWEIGQVIIEEK